MKTKKKTHKCKTFGLTGQCSKCVTNSILTIKLPLKNKYMERSKYWETMVNIVDRQFPKGLCEERGRALVILAHLELMLTGTKFDEDGDPL